jgi:hypothetical protein
MNSSNQNFKSDKMKDGFSFDHNGKTLKLSQGSLESVSGRIYEFLIQTNYHNELVFQIVRVIVENQDYIPVVSLEYWLSNLFLQSFSF